MSTSAQTVRSPADLLDEAFLRSMFQGAEVPLVVCEPDATIAASNNAANRLFAPSHRPVAGRELGGCFTSGERARVERAFSQALARLEPIELRTLVNGTEGERNFCVWFTPVVESDGSIRGVALSFRDVVTGQSMQRDLEKKSRLASLGSLAGAVAHHYNNLVCSLATGIEYAANMSSPTQTRRTLERLQEPLQRAAKMTQQLLAFAQADTRHRDLADLTECVLLFCDEIEETLRSRNITLEVDWQPIPIQPIPREALQIILQNLTDNACDAMKSGGVLRIVLGLRSTHEVRLTVSDTGAGIPGEIMEHIFEPFCTSKGDLGAGCGNSQQNPGLGLAVVHGLVNMLHGTISAANLPTGGAQFEVIFPIVANK